MKPIQLILIGVALVFAVTAGYLAMTMATPEPVVQQAAPVEQKPRMETRRVLAARQDIPMGTTITEENVHFVDWPKSGLNDTFLREDETTEEGQPGPRERAIGAVARSTFFAGEPIREAKLVRSDSGYLSAILPAGKRAVAINVGAVSAAGGFILPNDHVDVLMSRQIELEGSDQPEWTSETVLSNVRVLAIDQVIEEQDGEKSKVGETATLEVTPEQAAIVSVARRMSNGNLTLTLRSISDTNVTPGGADELLSNASRRRRGTIRLIRFGKTKELTPKK